MKSRNIEIMAPAGSFESLHAAIQGGANSVYFGAGKLNMRARSSNNFTIEELKEIVEICNKNNVKSYLTVNTIYYDNELEQLEEIFDAVKESGVHAVIASDIAAIQAARERDINVHISTQQNISNYGAVKYYAAFADVVVLARELNMEQVQNIHNKIIEDDLRGPSGNLMRIEMFVHGALCMAVSGKCYLSLHEYNKSANRGACYQTCRRGYEVTDVETGRQLNIDGKYIMSPKDLCTIHFLNKLIDSGVSILKIEGRARSPEYVKTVTESYREAVDAIQNDSYNGELISKLQTKLSTVFNRGFWDGYYLGQKLGEWSHKYGSQATTKKVIVGKCSNYFSKMKVAEFALESGELSVGEEILITGPTTGVVQTTVKEIRVDLKPVNKAVKGDRFSIQIDDFIRRSDKLYKIVPQNI